MTDYPNNISAKLEIIKASEITPKEVRYLLPMQTIPLCRDLIRRAVTANDSSSSRRMKRALPLETTVSVKPWRSTTPSC